MTDLEQENDERMAPARLWRYALESYARPGVAEECLRLQDSLDVDINLLLCAAWSAGEERCLDAEEFTQLQAHCEAWRQQVLKPLRAQRRLWGQARTMDSAAGTSEEDKEGATSADGAWCYEASKTLELEAERLQLAQLATRVAALESRASALLSDDSLDGSENAESAKRAAQLRENLSAYATALGLPSSIFEPVVALLAS